VIEEDLKGLRLTTEASPLRPRILALIALARRRRRKARWFHGIVAVSVTLMLLTFVFGTKAELRHASVSDPELRPRMPEPLRP
jgi:hypothetical protein